MKQEPMDPGMARALRSNGVMNLLGLGASFFASAWMVRSLDPGTYAQLGVVSAMVGVMSFFAEAGGNAGFTRFFHQAQIDGCARGFYSGMLRRRILGGLVAVLCIAGFGPFYAQLAGFAELRNHPVVFIGVAILCMVILCKWLPHYGLMAMLEPGAALSMQHGFLVFRSGASALGAMAGFGLPRILLIWIGIGLIELWCFHRKFLQRLPKDRSVPEPGFLREAIRYGFQSSLDKAAAMLGGGAVLLLFFAARYGSGDRSKDLAFLALGYEVTGKILGLTVMPMANLVTPYLSRVPSLPGQTARAGSRVCSLSALLYAGCISAAFVGIPWGIPFFYGKPMGEASEMVRLILVPMAVEAWARGIVSPMLLRNGESRSLVRLNVGQFLITGASVWIAWDWSLEAAVFTIGSARALAALVGVYALQRHLEPGTLERVGWIGLITVIAVLAGEQITRYLACGTGFLAGALFFLVVFGGGLGVLLCWDRELKGVLVRLLKGVFSMKQIRRLAGNTRQSQGDEGDGIGLEQKT